MASRDNIILTIIRWVFTLLILAGIWFGITWVLYLAITFIFIEYELKHLIRNHRDRGSIFERDVD